MPLLDALGTLLARSWRALGRSWDALGTLLGRSWTLLDALGRLQTEILVPTWPPQSILDRCGLQNAAFRSAPDLKKPQFSLGKTHFLLGGLFLLAKRSWTVTWGLLGASWAQLGRSWAPLGLNLEPLGRLLGLTWRSRDALGRSWDTLWTPKSGKS